MSVEHDIWVSVSKVTCLDCLHPKCMAISDAAKALCDAISASTTPEEP